MIRQNANARADRKGLVYAAVFLTHCYHPRVRIQFPRSVVPVNLTHSGVMGRTGPGVFRQRQGAGIDDAVLGTRWR